MSREKVLLATPIQNDRSFTSEWFDRDAIDPDLSFTQVRLIVTADGPFTASMQMTNTNSLSVIPVYYGTTGNVIDQTDTVVAKRCRFIVNALSSSNLTNLKVKVVFL